MAEYEIRPLTSDTWDAFADLCARNNGAGMGKCWCFRKVSVSLLHSGTRSMLERAGFTYDRPKGKNHCVMRASVASR